MKIALVQDQLLTPAGSERMFLYMVEEFPEADCFTIAYNPATTWPQFRNHQIKTHWASPFVQNHRRFKLFFPFLTYLYEWWDFRGYDVILSSSATTAKYLSRFDGLHICYCYFPTRAIWNDQTYFEQSGWKENLFRFLLPYFKQRDKSAARRVDRFIGISETTRKAIKATYDRDADVLYCPIDFERFSPGINEAKQSHYLIVSRLERWKQIDYAIEAFNKLGLPLRIVGAGEDAQRLKALAGPNVQFLGAVDDATLIREYGQARAVIFPPALEYGLVPLEACATGTPVIAIGIGGVTETMIPTDATSDANSEQKPTAVFYYEPTADSLMAAIRTFETLTFDRQSLAEHARNFDIPAFKKALRQKIEAQWATFSRDASREV